MVKESIELTLKELLDEVTQVQAARIIGCTQSAVSQMLRSGRDIRFIKENDQYIPIEIRKLNK